MELPPPPAGVTAVVALDLYSNEDHTEGLVSLPAEPTGDGERSWSVDTLTVAAGRWWGVVRAANGAQPVTYPLRDPIDLPYDERLIVSPEALAEEMGLPLPLAPSQRRLLTTAILDAQSDVSAYLGRPLTPQRYVQRGLYAWGDEWALSAHGDDDVIRVISATPEAGGTWTVTYIAGLDAARDEALRPIRRYVTAHAANSPSATRLWREVVNPTKTIKSASTQGQSVSYEAATLGGGGAAGSGVVGALPSRSTLDLWRLAGRRVHQGRTQFGARY